jgi:hypothetical protein
VTELESKKRLLKAVADLSARLERIEAKLDLVVAINAPTARAAELALESAVKKGGRS